MCVGIDAGSYESKLAVSDGLGTRIIARVPGFELVSLREEAEAFCDEPVFSCVVAGSLRVRSEMSGFTDVHTITPDEAIALALGRESRNVVYDLGASGCRIYALEAHELRESAAIEDVCGGVFDEQLAGYLADRFGLDNRPVSEARRIKHELTEQESTIWREVRIYRYEFERLIHFHVKRTARVLQRFCRVHKPECVILTGGSIKIPEVWKTLAEVCSAGPEYRGNVIAEGASLLARTIQKEGDREARRHEVQAGASMRELRAAMLELEDKLTRRQKDRLYSLFKQAEGMNDSGITSMMESLLREIRDA